MTKSNQQEGYIDFGVSPVASFDAFYRKHFARAVALAHALAGARAAEDIAQEAFWATFKKWEDLDHPERWLWKVIANRSRSALRRRYREAGLLPRLRTEAAPAQDEGPSDLEDFWDVVRALPRRQAQVVALLYVEELSTPEVAEVLGCS
ncbi:MAG: sigma-70 family RNA polymerase sigma factor, partial [Acidimicrobiia bacterium]